MSIVRATVRELLAQEPELTLRQIVARTGLTYAQVRKARWFLANSQRVKDVKNHYRRRIGIRPAVEVVAERQAEAAILSEPVLNLRRQGMSFSQIATELGLTRNQVAGRVRRARRGNMVEANTRSTGASM